MIKRSTLQLLRFHFSFFLMPVFLFAVSISVAVNWVNAFLIFIILHLLVYPSSNGYNSYMDRDDSPIGGLEKPLQPTTQLFVVSVIMDVIAVVAALMINTILGLGILFYIVASRAYSYRKIRLKRYPLMGFLTVFIFQGAVIFFISYYSISKVNIQSIPLLPCVVASLLIGASYPLTQVYQHQQDKSDGVTTISYVLGKRGTFIFSGFLFMTAAACLFYFFMLRNEETLFYLFLLITMPVVLFFVYWMGQVWKDGAKANFSNSLKMNVISTTCLNLYFFILIFINHFE